MLVTVLVGCVCCATLLWAALVVCGPGWRRRRRGDVAGEAGGTSSQRREEDRIRPAVDATGARIWAAEEDLFWHEIVHWAPRHQAADGPASGSHGA